MRSQKLFHLVSVSIISVAIVVLGLLMLNMSPLPVQAESPAEESGQYQNIYQILDDGTVIVSRTQVTPTQIRATQTCTQPAPELLEPMNGATLDTLLPDYTIEEVSADVFQYSFQLSAFSDFSSIYTQGIIDTFNPSPGSSLTFPSLSNLLPDQVYYWRVASICKETGEDGPFSAVYSFRTAPSGGDILPAPTVLAPEGGAKVGSLRVTFALEAVEGAVRYQFRYFDSAGDGWNDWDQLQIRDEPLTVSTFDDTLGLFGPEDTIHWRAAALNSYAIGQTTARRSLMTPPVMTSTQISPSLGGSLTPDPGNISVQFPPGAVMQQTTLSYTLQAKPDQDLANFRFANRAFTLEAGGGQITTFNQPFTITIKYDGWDLFAEDISDPADLNLVFWNGNQWEEILPCPGCSVDTVNQTVTVVLDHLTEFALVAPNEVEVYLPMIIK